MAPQFFSKKKKERKPPTQTRPKPSLPKRRTGRKMADYVKEFRDLTKGQSVDEQAMTFLKAFVIEFSGAPLGHVGV